MKCFFNHRGSSLSSCAVPQGIYADNITNLALTFLKDDGYFGNENLRL